MHCLSSNRTRKQQGTNAVNSFTTSPMAHSQSRFLWTITFREYLLSVIDTYSRFPEVEVVKSTAAGSIIPKLNRIFGTHGIPVKFICDNGPPFNGIEIEMYMKTWGIKFKPGTPLWPRQNAEVESFNRPLKKLLQRLRLKETIGERNYTYFYLTTGQHRTAQLKLHPPNFCSIV